MFVETIPSIKVLNFAILSSFMIYVVRKFEQLQLMFKIMVSIMEGVFLHHFAKRDCMKFII